MVAPIGKTGGVTNHTKMLLKEYKNMNDKIKVVNISPEKDYKYLNSIIKLYKRTVYLLLYLLFYSNDFDVIHIQASGPIGGFLPAIVSSFTKQFSKNHLIITFHHGNAETFINNHKTLFRYVIMKADLLLLVSQDQKRIISKIYGEEILNKTKVIPNGFDDEIVNNVIKNTPKEKSDFINLINVANLYQVKGQENLIKAISILTKEYKIQNIKCKIFGEGPLREKLNSLIKNNDIQNFIALQGWQPQKEIMRQLSNSDFFIMPSIKEGSPLAVFEALGFGLPVIASNVGGIPDVIIDERYGILITPEKPEELSNAIKYAISKKWNREIIIEYSKKFSWKNIAKTTYNEYESLVAQK
jgi:glycosyltransferase involved in cell wall biosynthesis